MDESKKWYLMKYEDGGVFGPVTFEQIRQWAIDAQISPLDKLSTDENTWLKAPMIPELEMDFLIEVSPDQYYGPTTIGALKEFIEMGEIGPDSLITNCKDGSAFSVKDYPGLQPAAPENQTGRSPEPIRTNIRVSLQQRIRDLEHSLLEERRAREAAEALVEKLEARLAELSTSV
ncbi:MAG: hypothetical protein WCD79_03620 [Chthoniobacteraceae bacterium]